MWCGGLLQVCIQGALQGHIQSPEGESQGTERRTACMELYYMHRAMQYELDTNWHAFAPLASLRQHGI